jgi:hypothetical protein
MTDLRDGTSRFENSSVFETREQGNLDELSASVVATDALARLAETASIEVTDARLLLKSKCGRSIPAERRFIRRIGLETSSWDWMDLEWMNPCRAPENRKWTHFRETN